MAKLKNPFHSLSAHGSIGRTLTVRRRSKDHIAQTYPDHPDANTPAQQGQRLMFTMCKDLWHTLSQAEQRTWESLARPFHMSGYSYYLSQCLRPNPGIYLPLAGGTMQGAVNMDSNRIQTLPAPGAPADPARLADLTTHAALTSGIHGLKGGVSFSAYQTSHQSIPNVTATKVAWHAESWDIGGYFDLVNNRFKPLVAGKYCLILGLRLTGLIANAYDVGYLYKNGLLYKRCWQYRVGSPGDFGFTAPALIDFNGSTDYVEWYIYHSRGAAINTYGVKSSTYCMGFLVAQS